MESVDSRSEDVYDADVSFYDENESYENSADHQAAVSCEPLTAEDEPTVLFASLTAEEEAAVSFAPMTSDRQKQPAVLGEPLATDVEPAVSDFHELSTHSLSIDDDADVDYKLMDDANSSSNDTILSKDQDRSTDVFSDDVLHDDISSNKSKTKDVVKATQSSKRLKGEKLEWCDVLLETISSHSDSNIEKSKAIKKVDKTSTLGQLTMENHTVMQSWSPSNAMLTIECNAKKAIDSIHLLRVQGLLNKKFKQVEMKCIESCLHLLKQYIGDLSTAENKVPRHHNDDVIFCSLCNHVFSSEDEKTRHFKCMHTTKFVCSVKQCKSSFSERRSLERHEKKHKIPKKKLKKCSKCKKTFRFKCELSYHMKAHSNKTYF